MKPQDYAINFDQDFDDVTVSDLVNANPILAFYTTKTWADDVHDRLSLRHRLGRVWAE